MRRSVALILALLLASCTPSLVQRGMVQRGTAPARLMSGVAEDQGLSTLTLTGSHLTTPFTDYVAMGDSITAGMQSAGLTAQSQDSAFPVLLGLRAGLKIAMPEVDDPGCPVPIASYGDRISPENIAGLACTRQHPEVVSPVVAVPGARVADVYNTTDVRVQNPDPLMYSAKLYHLVLGHDRTQLQEALSRHPKFITLWVGSNDVLMPTLRGQPDQSTPPGEFRANYAHLLDALMPSGARITVLTVPDVTHVPALIPVWTLELLGLVDATCGLRRGYFGSLSLAAASREHPLSCLSPSFLSEGEYEQAANTVNAYNQSIRELAAERHLAVFDVNPLLDELPGRPLIPNLAQPFGESFSADGVHPSSSTHELLARHLAEFMNQTYGTALNAGH